MSAENECGNKLKKKPAPKINANLAKIEMDDHAIASSDDSKSNFQPTMNEKNNEEEDKQMLGGCCVCGDDTGYSNNLLVYCDGVDCKVAVHQCCYGILNVPDDSWYCGSCKHKIELASNVIKGKCSDGGQHLHDEFKKLTCQLCPCRDGALKRTQDNKWAHVVCALYIPEISFGSVKTMEPIILKDVKSERFNKKCSICENKEDSCSQGVYVNCGDKNGCQEWFHVTCAQRNGLLCEESNTSSKNNLNYSIYCSVHLNRLLAQSTSSVKKLPPFNISLCPVSNPLNQNNLGKNLSNLIHCVNESLITKKKVQDLGPFIEAAEKEKSRDKLKMDTKRNSRSEPVNKPLYHKNSKDTIIDLSEKKKKRFSFNNSSAGCPRSTSKHSTNVNKVKLNNTNDNLDSLDKSKFAKTDSKTNECNLDESKPEQPVKIGVDAKLDNSKNQSLNEQIDNGKNDDCNSIKSFRSSSTEQSFTCKRKTSRAPVQTEAKKSKTIKKLDNEDSIDELVNSGPMLSLNLDENKLACHGGIVTPSTSSCASSTSSNFSKSPESLDFGPKSKESHQEQQKQIANTQTQCCIDVFGNFLNKQMDKSGETIASMEENNSLEEMLTKQWDLGANLCRNLSQKFDSMDLLDLLFKCKQDNLEMEKKIKLLEQTNLEHEQMSKKLSRSFTPKADETTPIRKLIQPLDDRTTPSISFNKVINDQVQNHVTTNKSSFQPSTNSLNYSTLIQQSLNYLHSKSPHMSPTTSSTNSLVNLYNSQMQNHQSPTQAHIAHFQSNAWHPATSNSPSQTPTKSNSLTAQNSLNSSLNSLLSQNQLLQSFQQLNPMQQQQIASYYYMAATSNPTQTIEPSTPPPPPTTIATNTNYNT